MYFENFPLTYYTLDNKASIQIVVDITKRNILADILKDNYSYYDNYDVKDGERPDIVADKFYDNSELHWLILHSNNILDPRFEWPKGYIDLVKFVDSKYTNRDGIHHYESNNEIVVGNIYANGNFTNINVNDIILNRSNDGIGVVVGKIDNSNVIINCSIGGFKQFDEVTAIDNQYIVNITDTTSIGCIPVTNFLYEERLNEQRRTIKVIKPIYVDTIVKEFMSKLGQ